MRLFPGARRQRAVAAMITLVAVLAVAVPVAYAGGHHDHLKHRATHVRSRIHQVSGNLEDASSQVVRITTRLRASQRRLVAARTAMVRVQKRLTWAHTTQKRLQRRLRSAQATFNRASARVTAAKANVDAQRTTTRNTVVDWATEGGSGLAGLASYLNATSMEDLVNARTGNDIVVNQELSALSQLQAAEARLTTQKNQVRTARNHVRSQKTAAVRTVTRIRGLVKQRVAAKRRVKALVSRTRKDRAAAVRARRADRAKLRRLRAQETRIRQQILARTAGDANRRVGNTRGMFVPPVRHSYITSPYGWRMHPIYHYWGLHDGDDLHAPCGTPEVAVGSGKVIEETFSDVWGHRLYLDLGRINGNGFVAIYNHISAYRSHVGERVTVGKTLALAGTTGWSTGCHLHFTLMRNGHAVDPAPFIGM